MQQYYIGKLYSILYKTYVNILSFSPQTNISEASTILNENKWTYNTVKADIWPTTNNKLLDLLFILKKPSDVFIYCICGESVLFDSLNIDYIHDYIDIKWKISGCHIHNSAYYLTKNNMLNDVLVNISKK